MFTHAVNAPITACNAGCIECSNPNDGVVFDVVVQHDESGDIGNLFICTGCLMNAAEVGWQGRLHMRGLSTSEER